MARAYAVAGEKSEAEKHIQLAKDVGEQIKGKEDRNLLFSDLETVLGCKKR
ncbi:hypothetical protein KAU92_03930 [Candidatus Bathyarchaeota archaeon]|nr:hypothetical protein [Candidatus Bathyarchaeota archaeon]